MRSGVVFIMLSLALISSCKKSSGSSAPAIEQKTTVAVDAGVDTTLSGPAALSGVSVKIPAGTLAVSTEIILEKGQEFTDSSLLSELSLPIDVTVPSVTSGLIIRPSVDVAVNGSLTITLETPTTGLRLANETLAIFYKSFDATSKTLQVGMKTSTDEDFSVGADGKVSFEGGFGIYWAATLSRVLSTDEKPLTRTSEISIVGSDGIAVYTKSGLVAEKTLATLAGNAWLQDFSQPRLLQNSGDIASGSKLQLNPDGTGFISAGVGSTTLTWTGSGSDIVAEFASAQGPTSGFQGSRQSAGVYNFYWKVGGSYEAEAETLTVVPLNKFLPLRVTAGETYALPLSNTADSHAEVLRFNADGSTTYLSSVDDTRFTWSQGPGHFTLKYGDSMSFKIEVLSTDTRQAKIYSSTSIDADGREFFATALGTKLPNGIQGFIKTFVGTYRSELFPNDGAYVFNEDRTATKLDRESRLTTYLWKYSGGQMVATKYVSATDGTAYETLNEMLACEAKTVTCKVDSSFSLIQLWGSDISGILLQRFFKGDSDEPYHSIIDSWYRK